jgi:hypothetical protein
VGPKGGTGVGGVGTGIKLETLVSGVKRVKKRRMGLDGVDEGEDGDDGSESEGV